MHALPFRILLVDDEPDILETMTPFLEWKVPDAQVTPVRSAELAISQLGGQSFDLMVTDYRMPGMDGVELTRQVRTKWPALPILMLTAYIDAGTLADIERSAPGLQILAKPVDMDQLLGSVMQIVRASRP